MSLSTCLKRGARIFAATLSVFLTGLMVTGATIAVPLFLLASPVSDYSLKSLQPASQRTLVLHSRDGKPFARRGGCVSEQVTLKEVPPHFIDALLSMEDRRFYYHWGVSIQSGLLEQRSRTVLQVASCKAAVR
jgi:membrane peptidoglycan carboxypeptidase